MAVFNAGSIEATLDLDLDPFQQGIAQARGEGRKFAAETFKAKLDADTTAAARGANNARRSLERAAQTYVANFEVRGLTEAAAEAAAMQGALGALSGDRTIGIDATSAATGVRSARRGIMALLPAIAILSTSLIPITAAAVPVLGLASNLTLAAAAGGTAILAFQGVGGALEAANKAGVEPTAENLAKMHAAMAALTPEARAFVMTLRDMGAEASGLQRTAAAGLFPGLTGGLESVDLNDYRRLVFALSDVAGDQLGTTLEALDDPRWVRFFDFLAAEARPGVEGLSTSVGNLAGMFAGWWQAFDPLNDDFTDWLVSSTGAWRDAAEGLPDNPEFLQFIAYVREQGPEAAATLSALGGALVDVIVAAAPLGGVVLDVLEGVGEAISFIAEQPFGSTLLTGLAAIYAVNKALAITQGLLTRAGMGATGAGMSGMLGGIGAKTADMRASIPTLSQLGTVLYRAGQGAENVDEKTRAARASVASLGRTAAVGAAGLGAMTLLSTDLGDSLGLTNTAMLGITGAMIGGAPGAVAGGIIGAFLDYRGSVNGVTDAIKAYNAATSNQFTTLSQQQSAVAALGTAYQDYASKVTGESLLGQMGTMLTPTGYMGGMDILMNGYDDSRAGKLGAEWRDAQMAAGDLDLGARLLAKGLGVADQASANSAITAEQMEAALLKAQPAMAALGISTADLQRAVADGSIMSLIGEIQQWNSYADTGAGRTEAFATSVAELGSDALSTAESASAMSAALEALLSPTLNLEAATDQWRISLGELANQLKSGAGFEGQTKAAQANRDMTRGYVEDSMARLTALAEVGTTTEKDMANAVAATRREFIQSGIAAGFSRKEITKRAREMGLTPKMVKTVFQAAGIDAADLKARQLRAAYKALPKDVRTQIRQEGVPKTMAEVNELVKRYELTEKQRQALITLIDRASPGLSQVERWLERLDGKRATTYIDTVRTGARTVPGLQMADGGPVRGPGTGTSDDVPIWGSNGEHMWTAKEVANAGGHAAVEAIRAQYRYATGGALEWARRPGVSARAAAAVAGARSIGAGGMSDAQVQAIIEAIRDNRGIYAPVSSREEIETALRGLEAQLRKVS